MRAAPPGAALYVSRVLQLSRHSSEALEILPDGVVRSILDMLRAERSARLFFLAHAQSAFGNGIGYVALILVAYDRYPSAWGITLVLLADFLPGTLFGALLGAAADRWSRRRCAVAADVARAIAFIGIAFVSGIEATVALALLAGLGTGLFSPSILAGLPTLVAPERTAPAMSLYGMLNELGTLLGSSIAALLLLVADPETLLIANGASFAVSALIVATLPFAPPAARDADAGPRASLLRETGEGFRAARELPGMTVLIGAGAAVLLFAGALAVVELLYATQELDAGDSGFSVLVALSGAGIVIGNAVGSRGGTIERLRRSYLFGLMLMALALIGMALAPTFALACICFVAMGIGNGMVLFYGRLLMQRTVPEHLLGRIYGVWYAVTSGAFAIAFIATGALADAVGVRELLAVGGVGGLCVWLWATPMLRREWPAEAGRPLPADG
jgi:MFS family permease